MTIVLLGNGAILPAPLEAREKRRSIDIPPGPIADGISTLSRLTGISVGLTGPLPSFPTPRVAGARSAADALRQLLAGSGYRAIEVAPTVWRIEPVPRPRTMANSSEATAASAAETVTAPDIIVTGQKRPQDLMDVPMSLAVIRLADSAPPGLFAGSHDIALSADGLSLTNLGPGRNRQFIRGVADSPFNGSSQATVAVQLDDARINFDAPDPDLHLVDMERVELLKGPQGPLYGSGALGGIYHLVTRKPDAGQIGGYARWVVESVQHGGIGTGGEASLNLPIIKDRLAARAVAYDLRGAGWIDRDGRKKNANSSRILGGRLALRWQPSPGWTVDLGGVVQNSNVADSQYVTSKETLKRTGDIAEPTDNDFREAHLTVEARLGGLRLVSATSYVDHIVNYTLDASTAASQFQIAAPLLFHDHRRYAIFNQELRLSPAHAGRWLIGASYMRAHSHSVAALKDSAGAGGPVQTLDRVISEYALFGELTVPLANRLDVSLGARVYHTSADNEAAVAQAQTLRRINTTALAPSVALSWRPSAHSIVYLRYAGALRPGGLAATDQPSNVRFKSDELDAIDIGLRHRPTQGGAGFSLSAYYTSWSHIQSDYLLANGLVSTRNAGRGRIIGAEASLDWWVLRNLRLSAGINLQRARLVSTETGAKLDDRRLPIAPDLTARAAITYDFALTDRWQASLFGQANYIGGARLALDDALDRRMGAYAVSSVGATMTHDRLTIAARIDNLFDARGDSFAFGNQFSIMTERQFTPLRPRSFTFSLQRRW